MSSIEDLLAGYRLYRKHYYREHQEELRALVQQQTTPKIALICCSDNKLDPSVLFNTSPGDLFVIRNLAGLVPSYEKNGLIETAAALEYAVCELQVEHIVVLGHAQCGGVRALMTSEAHGRHFGEYIGDWMDVVHSAYRATKSVYKNLTEEEQCSHCEKATLQISLRNLISYPWVHERVLNHSLQVHGWFYDISSGLLARWEAETGQFMLETGNTHHLHLAGGQL